MLPSKCKAYNISLRLGKAAATCFRLNHLSVKRWFGCSCVILGLGFLSLIPGSFFTVKKSLKKVAKKLGSHYYFAYLYIN